MWRLISCVLITFLCISDATNVKQCKSGKPFPLSVNVVGCQEPPCDVYKGGTAVMEVHFVGTKKETKSLTTKVYATVMGLHMPYDLPEDVSNVCQNLMYDAMCPIYKDEDVVYKFNFYVDPSYPELTLNVEVSLVDEKNEAVACFICSCKIKKPISGPTQQQLLLE